MSRFSLFALALIACGTPAPVEVADTEPVEPVVVETCPETVEPTVAPTSTVADTDLDDWAPLVSGNLPNALTADDCADGESCFDCVHVPTGTYARWYLDADGNWFEAVLGTLPLGEGWDATVGSGLGDDGVYYAVDTMAACVPFYELHVQ